MTYEVISNVGVSYTVESPRLTNYFERPGIGKPLFWPIIVCWARIERGEKEAQTGLKQAKTSPKREKYSKRELPKEVV